MNRVTKRNISSFFTYYGIAILVIGAFCTAGFSLLINIKFEPTILEKLSMFATGKEWKDQDITDVAEENEVLLDNGLRKFDFHYVSYQNKDVASYYQAYGAKADYLLLSNTDIADMKEALTTTFVEITPEITSSLFLPEETEFYSVENKNYAIKIFNHEGDNIFKFDNLIDFPEDYYLLLNTNSAHYDKETNKFDSLYIEGLKFIFSRYAL